MKRFEIIAKDFSTEKNLQAEVLVVVKELQAKNISPIEVRDYEENIYTLYRKGTQDKNYFVRTKELPASTNGDSDTSAVSDTGNNENQMSDVPKVDNKRKGRSVKK